MRAERVLEPLFRTPYPRNPSVAPVQERQAAAARRTGSMSDAASPDERTEVPAQTHVVLLKAARCHVRLLERCKLRSVVLRPCIMMKKWSGCHFWHSTNSCMYRTKTRD